MPHGPVRSHGRGYRRTVAVLAGLAVVVYLLVGRPWMGVGTQEAVLRLVAFALVVGGGSLWFALWPGLTWDARGVTLIYAFRRRRVSWPDLAGVEWRPRGSMGKCLMLHTVSGKDLRVPTVMKVDGTDWWARLWESNLLRDGTRSDDAPDAMSALTQAREAATRTGDS